MSDLANSDSRYDDQSKIASLVAEGRHRDVIGGPWNEIGSLQFEFLKRHGLLPPRHLIDVGCGSLWGGVHFAAYVQPGHYWGIDANDSCFGRRPGPSARPDDGDLRASAGRAGGRKDAKFAYERHRLKTGAAPVTKRARTFQALAQQ